MRIDALPMRGCDQQFQSRRKAVPVILHSRGERDHTGTFWIRAFAAYAVLPPLSIDHALHLCKSPLAGDPIIGAIRFTSVSQSGHSPLHRQPYVNQRFLGHCD
jgi:hypothetical protein